MYNPYDHYFKKAKKEWFKARSVFKLEEIDTKFNLIDKKTIQVLDIWASPGSWLQYLTMEIKNTNRKIIWLDLNPIDFNSFGLFTYEQDATDVEAVEKILESNHIRKLDLIVSDMAPNTIGVKDIDAIRSLDLIERTFPLYEKFLKEEGRFVIKIFMGPGFEEFLKKMKDIYGGKRIKTFKPKSVRKHSKEIYIIKV